MLAVLSAFFFPSSAWAADAFITSGGSTNKNSPTPIAIGQTLSITGYCRKGGFLDSRETSYLRVSPPDSPSNHEIGRYSSAYELDHISASLTVGTAPYTESAGNIFKIELSCRGSSSNGYAERFYRVMAAPKLPIVEPFGIWMDGWINEKTVDITTYVTDAGSGIGKVWIKWTGETANDIEMTDKGEYYQHTIDVSGMQDGAKDVEIWAETPSHANNGWQPAGSFILDRTPPALSDGSIDDRLHQAVVRIHAADNLTGVRSVEIRWEAGAGGRWQQADMKLDRAGDYLYTIDKDGLRSGNIAVQIRASDGTGNETDWISSGSITVNHPLPTIAWDEQNAKFAKDTMHVRANVKAGSGFRIAETWIWWNGAPQSGYRMTRSGDGYFTYDIPTAELADQSQQKVMFWAKDNAGSATSWLTPTGASFTVDKSTPSIEWDDTNAAYTKGGTTIKANISDTASGVKDVWITWTGERSKAVKMLHGGGSRYSYAIPALPDGVKEVQIWAADNIGNGTGWVRKGSFIVDKTAPVVNWLAPRDQAVLTDDKVRITGNLVEENPDVVTIEWQAEDETAWQSHVEKLKAGRKDFEYELSGLKRGVNYRLRIQAADKAGNASSLTPARTVIGQLPANVLFKSSRFDVLDDSLADKDNSGGLSSGDDLIYIVELEAASIDAIGVSLRYALPPGLALTSNLHPYFAPDSAIADGAKLNAHWNGASDAPLLIDGIDLPAHKKLIVHIPVTIASSIAAPIDSAVLAGARNAKDELRREHRLTPQDKYPAHSALDLWLASSQPNWKYRPGTAFDYRITVHVREWDLTDVELRYALPPGLERNGDLHIEGDGADAVRLNSAWGKDGEKLLLSSIRDIKLNGGHAFDVIVPVKVSAGTAPGSVMQSDIEARASNLSAPVRAMHLIVLDDSAEPEEQLVLEKTVDKKNAAPGETLRYTIRFRNVGIDPLYDPVIKDSIQTDYLTLQKAHCDSSISINLHCSVVHELPPGELEWRLNGTLEAGDFGSVSYEVTVIGGE